MAVYKRTYRPYTGALTPTRSRFLILYRYSRRGLFRSKLQTAFFALCFFFPILCLLAVYLTHNLDFLSKYGLRGLGFLKVDNKFFFYIVDVQGVLALILTAFIGPGLVSPDLANGALPLYLCRPFSRVEYVLGRMSAIAILLSYITWIPGLVIFLVQASLAGPRWLWDNLWIAGSILLACWIWIAILSLLALALSAWVRWRIVASALLLALLFLGSGFGAAINAVMRTKLGNLVNVFQLIATVWIHLFRVNVELPLSALQAWIALLALCAFCLYLLMRKVRAFEVVK